MILKLLEVLIFSSLFLLSFILGLNPMKVNVKANRWFGVFLLLWASYWFDEFWMVIGGVDMQISSYWFIALSQFFTPIVFFISVSFFSEPGYRIREKGIWFLILPVIYLFVIILDQQLLVRLYPIQLSLMLLNAVVFSVLSLLKIRKHRLNVQQYASSTQEINLNWLEYIIMATVVLTLGISVFNLMFFDLPLNLPMNVMVIFIVFFIAYNALKQKEVFLQNSEEIKAAIDINEVENDDSHKRALLSQARVEELKEELKRLMNEKMLFLDSELNLIKLAEQLNVTSHQLSYVINKGFSENFFQFVNRYRVEKAKLMLADSANNKLSILGVAYESGFSSKTSFNTTFKKMTEQTPSEFKKKCSTL